MAAQGGLKSVIAALLANLGIAVAKIAGFVVTRSSSLLAEGIHSLADSGNQALLLLGMRRARKPPSREHPFGYGRERYFWAFVVSVVLFALGAGYATFEGINKIRHPHEIKNLWWAVGILALGIVLESFSFRLAIKESNKVRGKQGWWSFIRRSRSPELPVVVLEDFGALLGLILALAAVLLAKLTGNPVWDGIGTLSIGILLGLIAIVLAIEMKRLLIGEGALPEHRKKLLETAKSVRGVREVIHMRTQHIGPDKLLIGLKELFEPDLSTVETAGVVDDIQARLEEAVPYDTVSYVEPELKHAAPELDHAAPELDHPAPELEHAAPELEHPPSPEIES